MKKATKVRARPRAKRARSRSLPLRFGSTARSPSLWLKSIRNRTRDLEYAVAAGDASQVQMTAKDIRWLLRPFAVVTTAELSQ